MNRIRIDLAARATESRTPTAVLPDSISQISFVNGLWKLMIDGEPYMADKLPPELESEVAALGIKSE